MKRRSLLKAIGFNGLNGFDTKSLSAQTFDRTSAFVNAARPYQNKDFNGVIETQNIPIQGKIPKELRGSLYRNGAARFHLGGASYKHWFDGDGMVQAFHFEDGKASHRGVLLRTPKLEKENKAGRFLYSGFGTDFADSLRIENPDMVNPANINLLAINNGKDLYALWEGGSALQIEPKSLGTIGFKSWSAQTAVAPFSAHPRRFPDGTIWNFGYSAGSGGLILYEIDAHGLLKREAFINAPQADMVHDFAITENYLVFLLMPLSNKKDAPPIGSLNRYEWRNQAPMIVMLVKKADFSVKYFELPNGGVFHLGNAWEEGGVIRIGYARYTKFLEHLKSLSMPSPKAYSDELAAWENIEINTMQATVNQFQIGLQGVEFPSFDLRRTGLKTDFTVLMQNTHLTTDASWGADTVLSLFGEKVQRYTYGNQWIAEEHIFVPNAALSDSRLGWVLGTAFNVATQKTTLSIFSANSIANGPLAQLELPYGLPLGLHGQFIAK
jgi:all-trans-8'-apo-beta-carotenal 15,15'-oxygenase